MRRDRREGKERRLAFRVGKKEKKEGKYEFSIGNEGMNKVVKE